MVRILTLAVYKHDGVESPAVKLAQTQDLSDFSFFTRRAVSEHLNFACRTICQRTEPGTRQTVDLPDNPFLCHVYTRFDNLCGVVVADKDYPQRAAFGLINQFLDNYMDANKGKWKEEKKDVNEEPAYLTSAIQKWQNPEEADKMMKIQKNLDDIKNVMHKNIEQVLTRGQKLDDLMEKSDDLSAASKQFYKQAKKTNQCCKMY